MADELGPMGREEAKELARDAAASAVKSARRPGCLFWGVVIVGLLWLAGSYQMSKDKEAREAVAHGSESADGKETLLVQPDELLAQFSANEVRAKQFYQYKRLKLKGKITAIDLNISGDPVITLGTSDPFNGVLVGFTKEEVGVVSLLSKGQKLTTLCDRVDKILGSPILNDCTIIEDQPSNSSGR